MLRKYSLLSLLLMTSSVEALAAQGSVDVLPSTAIKMAAEFTELGNAENLSVQQRLDLIKLTKKQAEHRKHKAGKTFRVRAASSGGSGTFIKGSRLRGVGEVSNKDVLYYNPYYEESEDLDCVNGFKTLEQNFDEWLLASLANDITSDQLAAMAAGANAAIVASNLEVEEFKVSLNPLEDVISENKAQNATPLSTAPASTGKSVKDERKAVINPVKSVVLKAQPIVLTSKPAPTLTLRVENKKVESPAPKTFTLAIQRSHAPVMAALTALFGSNSTSSLGSGSGASTSKTGRVAPPLPPRDIPTPPLGSPPVSKTSAKIPVGSLNDAIKGGAVLKVIATTPPPLPPRNRALPPLPPRPTVAKSAGRMDIATFIIGGVARLKKTAVPTLASTATAIPSTRVALIPAGLPPKLAALMTANAQSNTAADLTKMPNAGPAASRLLPVTPKFRAAKAPADPLTPAVPVKPRVTGSMSDFLKAQPNAARPPLKSKDERILAARVLTPAEDIEEKRKAALIAIRGGTVLKKAPIIAKGKSLDLSTNEELQAKKEDLEKKVADGDAAAVADLEAVNFKINARKINSDLLEARVAAIKAAKDSLDAIEAHKKTEKERPEAELTDEQKEVEKKKKELKQNQEKLMQKLTDKGENSDPDEFKKRTVDTEEASLRRAKAFERTEKERKEKDNLKNAKLVKDIEEEKEYNQASPARKKEIDHERAQAYANAEAEGGVAPPPPTGMGPPAPDGAPPAPKGMGPPLPGATREAKIVIPTEAPKDLLAAIRNTSNATSLKKVNAAAVAQAKEKAKAEREAEEGTNIAGGMEAALVKMGLGAVPTKKPVEIIADISSCEIRTYGTRELLFNDAAAANTFERDMQAALEKAIEDDKDNDDFSDEPFNADTWKNSYVYDYYENKDQIQARTLKEEADQKKKAAQENQERLAKQAAKEEQDRLDLLAAGAGTPAGPPPPVPAAGPPPGAEDEVAKVVKAPIVRSAAVKRLTKKADIPPGAGNSLLDAITKGTALKSVKDRKIADEKPQQQELSPAEVIANNMLNRRAAMEGNNNTDEGW